MYTKKLKIEKYFKKETSRLKLHSKIQLLTPVKILEKKILIGTEKQITLFTTPSVFKLKHNTTENTLEIYIEKSRKKDLDVVKTFKLKLLRDMNAIKNNTVKIIKLRYYYKHFPVIIEKKSKSIILKNCMGYRASYQVFLMPNVSAKVENVDITLSSFDYDALCITAARLKKFHRCNKYWLGLDKRVFRDGIYLL